MPDTNIVEQMRAEWNERAREDAYYYVAFGRKDQEDDEFFATAADVVRALEVELKRVPGSANQQSRRALEIGCGPGRLMRPMSRNFGEIHGVDVSDEMIRLAREKLRNTANAFPIVVDGTGLACYADEFFDYVYSYAVFQHIPSRDVVFSYLTEARRVLKPGGILRCQINGLPATARKYNTWEGVRISAKEVAEFACANDFQFLAIEGADTQYMWVTLRKRPSGWFQALAERPPRAAARIYNIVNAHSDELVVTSRGRFAWMSIWIDQLPEDCDLNQINIKIDGLEAAAVYIGAPVFDGLSKVNAQMPPGARTGLLPVDVFWFGERLCETGWVRVLPPGPPVPRLTAVSDGVNLLSGHIIFSRTVKLFLEELAAPERLEVQLDGAAIPDLDLFCTDPVNQSYEVNFHLPDSVAAGAHTVELKLGSRVFPAVGIDVRG
jgi:SAM-dependent methyltransferase